MTDKPYLSIEEVAQRFGVNPTTVYRLVQRGALPAFKIGAQWRFSQELLESWVAGQMAGDGPKARRRRSLRGRGGPARMRDANG